ncbi:TetR family transcriptional regulator [Amycolatopsis sp. PS_44_ISF1]|uniref:TetR/AcrR family transcriptional regulator n=1 Tax=Amycolatopsis sp. PS_44_ISF1 TaxID=2974917 RepID=UPI0028E00335|nr:TetR family transcriptional regulator [Amycolatopsis sp. PS_44_ISF1]MDT8913275.1 TetR family transcriptional regulator [Amycolatopsis sp. PS_44_ISF1]
MPTGIHIRDARRQLFLAAERVLLREGPAGLTSRAVTDEAGVAKGVLHRHFADFDDFLAELVRECVARIEDQAALLRASAGIGSVTGNVTGAVTAVFDPIAVAVTGLVMFRDEVRARLRETSGGIPVLAEARAMLAAYLTEERALGRLAADADAESLALALIGAGHLLFADRTRPEDPRPNDPRPDAMAKVVTAILADALQRRLL